MTVEELFRRYAAGERDFAGIDLSGANLNFATLLYLEVLGTRTTSVGLIWVVSQKLG